MSNPFKKPKAPKIEAPKPAPKREDVATPEKTLQQRAKRRGVAATLLSNQAKLGSDGKLGG